MKNSIKLLFWCLLGVFIAMVLWVLCYLISNEPIYRSFDIRKYKRFPKEKWDEIKTGDLLICRNNRMSWIFRGLWGCQTTHVGVFHRSLENNKLYVFEAVDGLHYTLFEDVYFTYSGDLFVRQLKEPLSQESIEWTQDTIDHLYNHENRSPNARCITFRDDTMPVPVRAFVSTNPLHRNEPFQIHRNSENRMRTLCTCTLTHLVTITDLTQNIASYAVVCTDVILVLLKQWKLVPDDLNKQCIKPDWFSFQSPEINAVYEEMMVLKDYHQGIERKSHLSNLNGKIISNDISLRC
jgi:hypothetical protein